MNSIEKSNQLAKSMCASGYRYLYGAKGENYTSALVRQFAAAYPGVFSADIKALALKDADKGYIAIDCSGFVCKVLGVSSAGSAGLRSAAVKRLAVTKANAKEGMAIWKNGHIAYIGEGLKIYEAASTATDMRVSKFEDRAGAFQELLIVKGSALAAGATTTAKGTNPYTQPTTTLKLGAVSEGVKWVQWELNQAGANLNEDGVFGPLTLAAAKAFQQSCKIEVDGEVGPISRKYLIADV